GAAVPCGWSGSGWSDDGASLPGYGGIMSDLDGLIGDLGEVTRVSPKAARRILQKTAEPSKEFWKGAASKGRRSGSYASAITYNTQQLANGAEGEMGAD